MAKLYPPRIEGTLPAFYGTTLVVPFSMNRAVGASEVKNLVLKMKKVNTNEVILTKTADYFSVMGNSSATFLFTAEEIANILRIGQFYRVQLAFVDQADIIGYFSTIGVIKYTGMPEVTLVGLNRAITNMHTYDYVGKYEQILDPTEKLYSSRLCLYNSNGGLVYDSGEMMHSVLNDTIPSQALELFQFNQDLEFNQVYKLRLTMTTINGLVISSPYYKVMQRENTDMVFDETRMLKVKVESNFDEGHTTISLEPREESKEIITGTFLLSRTEAVLPYKWEKIQNFLVKGDKIKEMRFTDYTVEQGKTYIYSIQQYNNYNVYSGRILSNEVYVDFEDVFILDGERQLKVRFNPRVSSMKNSVLETKVNTIGSKYPFITRNGRVNYKEFVLSGLVSYQMDDNATFIDWKKLNLDTIHTNLTSDNIYAERIFKLEVLDWLNNGKPKILKTTTEGNYIVRIMGVTMAPNDTVGRMLHTFNCTASEIAPFEYDYLVKHNFIALQDLDKTITRWKTINFSERIPNGDGGYIIEYKTGELLTHPVQSIRLTDMIPGSKFYVNLQEFYIGSTGAYYAKTETPIQSFKLPEDAKYSGSMIIEYQDILSTSFDDIRNMVMEEIPAQQFIGNSNTRSKDFNLIDEINDVKTKIVNIPEIRFTKRKIQKIYVRYDEVDQERGPTRLNKYYINGYSTSPEYLVKLYPNKDLEPLSLYEIYYSAVDFNIVDVEGVLKYERNGEIIDQSAHVFYDPYHDILHQYIGTISTNLNQFLVEINGENIDLTETEERIIKGVEPITSIRMGYGVIADMTYYRQTMEYSFEYEHEVVAPLRKKYDRLLAQLQNCIVDYKPGAQNPENLLIEVKSAYADLIAALEVAIEEKYTQGG